jgi:hypothetical protein
MLEDLGPIHALKRSGALLRSTWGENLSAQFGFGLFGLFAMLPGIFVIAIGAASASTAVVVVTAALGVAWIVVVSLAVSALTGIYRTALYRFAVDGAAPPAFAGADLAHALGPRRGPSGFGGFSNN